MAKNQEVVARDAEIDVDVTQKKKIGASIGDRIFDAIIYIAITVICLVCLYPMLYVVFASVSNGLELYTHVGPIWYPLQPMTLQGYQLVLARDDIWSGYANTIIYVIGSTIFAMLVTILGAYVLSRRGYKLKTFFNLYMVITMYIGGGMIPTFMVVKYLGLLNTRWAIILVGTVSTWNMIVMKTAFAAVPQGLEEAAIIDGANELQVLVKVILPTSKANIAVITLFYVVGMWNSWFNAMIYLKDRSLYPLQLFLREILVESTALEGSMDVKSGEGMNYIKPLLQYCTIVVSTLPILCAYPFAQRYFVKGVMMGSLKE